MPFQINFYHSWTFIQLKKNNSVFMRKASFIFVVVFIFSVSTDSHSLETLFSLQAFANPRLEAPKLRSLEKNLIT